MKFCRIDLDKTDYSNDTIPEWCYLIPSADDILTCNAIYTLYCHYKKFDSVMPLFDRQFTDEYTDVIGYKHDGRLVAFSLIKHLDEYSVDAVQFAWDYADPSLKFGYKSLEVECAIYKELGFKYLYLGEAARYKSMLDGYEILGPL